RVYACPVGGPPIGAAVPTVATTITAVPAVTIVTAAAIRRSRAIRCGGLVIGWAGNVHCVTGGGWLIRGAVVVARAVLILAGCGVGTVVFACAVLALAAVVISCLGVLVIAPVVVAALTILAFAPVVITALAVLAFAAVIVPT